MISSVERRSRAREGFARKNKVSIEIFPRRAGDIMDLLDTERVDATRRDAARIYEAYAHSIFISFNPLVGAEAEGR